MDTTVKFNDISSSYTTSRAGLLTYPTTAMPDFNAVYIYDVINGMQAVASGMLNKIQSKLTYPEVELYREKIIVKHDDFVRFKNHLEATDIQENPSLDKLIKKFSK
jgi:hypothetical protein